MVSRALSVCFFVKIYSRSASKLVFSAVWASISLAGIRVALGRLAHHLGLRASKVKPGWEAVQSKWRLSNAPQMND